MCHRAEPFGGANGATKSRRVPAACIGVGLASDVEFHTRIDPHRSSSSRLSDIILG